MINFFKIKNKKFSYGFLAIILIIGFLGFLIYNVNLYLEKQSLEKHYLENLIKTQEKSLKIYQQELLNVKKNTSSTIEQIKSELEKEKQKRRQIEIQSEAEKEKLKQKIESISSKIEISSSEIQPYLTGVINVLCGGVEGSGSLWKIKSLGSVVITNRHITKAGTLGYCYFVPDNHFGFFKLNFTPQNTSLYQQYLKEKAVLNLNSDIDVLYIEKYSTLFNKVNDTAGPKTQKINRDDLNYNISFLRKCPNKMDLGSPVVVIGYPAFGERKINIGEITASMPNRIVTEGIISGYQKLSLDGLSVLSSPDYYISAKIDSGNSGGIAISKDKNGLCLLGIPTWLSLGNYENQGVVQNINNIIIKLPSLKIEDIINYGR